jgi:hypothetical protein
MDFVKKYYDKIIFSAVLLCLVVVLLGLPFVISSDQQKLKVMTISVIAPKVTPLPPLDLSRQADIVQRLQSPVSFDFSTPNRLFNPLEWKRTPDGTMFPIKNGNETGAAAAVVTKITPLYFVIAFDSVETNGAAPRYAFIIQHQAAAYPVLRRPQHRYASAGEKTDVFMLSEIDGDPLDPSGLVLKLTDSGDMVTISRDKPFQRVDAYAADLRYDLEKKFFAGRRVGSMLAFGGEDYIVVAVDADEVILSAQSNQKKYILRYTP